MNAGFAIICFEVLFVQLIIEVIFLACNGGMEYGQYSVYGNVFFALRLEPDFLISHNKLYSAHYINLTSHLT